MTPEKLKQRRLEREEIKRNILRRELKRNHGEKMERAYYGMIRNMEKQASESVHEINAPIIVERSDVLGGVAAIAAIVFAVLVLIWRHF